MARGLLMGILCLALFVPSMLVAESSDARLAAENPANSLLASYSPAAAPQDPNPATVRPNSSTQERSYTQEVHPRRRRHISKGEIIFMAGIAGTSMGIGAIAGGGTGLPSEPSLVVGAPTPAIEFGIGSIDKRYIVPRQAEVCVSNSTTGCLLKPHTEGEATYERRPFARKGFCSNRRSREAPYE